MADTRRRPPRSRPSPRCGRSHASSAASSSWPATCPRRSRRPRTISSRPRTSSGSSSPARHSTRRSTVPGTQPTGALVDRRARDTGGLRARACGPRSARRGAAARSSRRARTTAPARSRRSTASGAISPSASRARARTVPPRARKLGHEDEKFSYVAVAREPGRARRCARAAPSTDPLRPCAARAVHDRRAGGSKRCRSATATGIGRPASSTGAQPSPDRREAGNVAAMSDDWRVTATFHEARRRPRARTAARARRRERRPQPPRLARCRQRRRRQRLPLRRHARPAAHEAEHIVREILAHEGLSATSSSTTGTNSRRSGKTQSVPLPQTDAEREPSTSIARTEETEDSQESGLAAWEVRVELRLARRRGRVRGAAEETRGAPPSASRTSSSSAPTTRTRPTSSRRASSTRRRRAPRCRPSPAEGSRGSGQATGRSRSSAASRADR